MGPGNSVLSMAGPFHILRPMSARLARFLFLPLLVAQAAAQSDGPRLVRIEVIDTSGKAIASARVTVRETETTVRSDSNGVALLKGVPHSVLNLTVNRIGFQPAEVALAADSTRLRVSLQPRPEQIAGVESRSTNSVPGGFAKRRAKGTGVFFTPDQVAHAHALAPSELLQRLKFVQLVASRDGHGVRFSNPVRTGTGMSRVKFGRQTDVCMPIIILDGKPAPNVEIDDLFMEEVLAIEVYQTEGMIPPELKTGAAMGCGAIVVWTPEAKGDSFNR